MHLSTTAIIYGVLTSILFHWTQAIPTTEPQASLLEHDDTSLPTEPAPYDVILHDTDPDHNIASASPRACKCVGEQNNTWISPFTGQIVQISAAIACTGGGLNLSIPWQKGLIDPAERCYNWGSCAMAVWKDGYLIYAVDAKFNCPGGGWLKRWKTVCQMFGCDG
jgi:hypothetical protein